MTTLLTPKDIDNLGTIRLEDLKEALNRKVPGDRAYAVSDELMKPLVENTASYDPQEFLAGCVMSIMRVLAGAAHLVKAEAAKDEEVV